MAVFVATFSVSFMAMLARKLKRHHGQAQAQAQAQLDDRRCPLGLFYKSGAERIRRSDYEAALSFVRSEVWKMPRAALAQDELDPLLAQVPATYGAFMSAFDFHLTPRGPKLIEMNTNADGFMSVIRMFAEHSPSEAERLRRLFVDGLLCEFRSAVGDASARPQLICIVDECAAQQHVFGEYCAAAQLLTERGLPTKVASPEQLRLTRSGLQLQLRGEEEEEHVDMVYLRISSDKRLLKAAHAHIRSAAQRGLVVVTPRPAVFAHSADKRLLQCMAHKHEAVPRTRRLSERALSSWWRDRARWVFKPAMGHASRGVVVGAKMTRRQLRRMDKQSTLCQLFVTTRLSHDDATRYDLRLYCHGAELLAPVSRHFEGDKMNLSSPKAGIRRICVVDDDDAHTDVAARFMPLPRVSVAPEKDAFLSPSELREQAQRREADRRATRQSALHQLDIDLRRATAEMMRAASQGGARSKREMRSGAKAVSRIRQQVLQEAKAKVADGQSSTQDCHVFVDVFRRQGAAALGIAIEIE